jgi:hypothetical protein
MMAVDDVLAMEARATEVGLTAAAEERAAVVGLTTTAVDELTRTTGAEDEELELMTTAEELLIADDDATLPLLLDDPLSAGMTWSIFSLVMNKSIKVARLAEERSAGKTQEKLYKR